MKKPASFPIALMAALLVLDVLVLIFEKIGAAAAGNAVGNEFGFYIKLCQQPWIWIVLALSPLQLIVWTKILSKTDLSLAYPVSSLCFPATMIASALIFHEHVPPAAWIGGALIAAGIAIAGGEHESHPEEENDEVSAVVGKNDTQPAASSVAVSEAAEVGTR